MTANEAKIDAELIVAQGKKQDISGYYQPSEVLTSNAMRPSKTFIVLYLNYNINLKKKKKRFFKRNRFLLTKLTIVS